MATYLSIYMDFLKAFRQANELENIAETLSQCADRETDCLGNLQTMWQGSSANAYYEKLSCSAECNQAVSEQIRHIAHTVRVIASRTYNAEREALDRARNREN